MDREKVIKGLECCHNKNMLWQHDQCPYHGFDEDCESNLHADALALLKEQDELLHKKQNDVDRLCNEISEWKHKFHDKEQEAVEPHSHMTDDSDLYFTCGKCGHVIWSEGYKFCPMCATRIAWNGEGR